MRTIFVAEVWIIFMVCDVNIFNKRGGVRTIFVEEVFYVLCFMM